ncbi:MAG: DNA internalization-related competence protein ComEC/Rec2 [Calditrichaeota bacterium]|nr:DNA internalization-related competence protein ComEC/Rec2 [Calditrichota bacterium]
MDDILKRLQTKPALKALLPFLLGIIAAYLLEPPPVLIFGMLIFFAVISLVSLKFSPPLAGYFLLITLISAGAMRLSLSSHLFSKNHIKYFTDTRENLIVTGEVCGFPQKKNSGMRIEFEPDTVLFQGRSYATEGKILLRLRNFVLPLAYGDRLKFLGKIETPPGERNPGDFNYRKFLAAQGIYGLVNIRSDWQVICLPQKRSFSILALAARVKAKIAEQIDKLYSGDVAALLKGLLIGERSEISYRIRDSFARSGVIHALAISGLHVGYILLIFWSLLGVFRVPRRQGYLLIILGLIAYNLIVGFKPPIVRASLMAGIFLLGKWLQRPIDIWNVISAAALIILLIHPQDLFQASFQLSFAAVIAIIYGYQKLKILFEKSALFRKLTVGKFGNSIGTLFLVSLSAQLGTLPLTVYYFHRVPLIAVFMNLIVIPLVGVVIAYGFASLIFSFLIFAVGDIFAYANTLFARILLALTNVAGNFHWASADVFVSNFQFVVLFYILLWIFLNINKKRVAKIALFLALILGNISLWGSVFSDDNWLYVTFLDVGQGDSIFIQFPDGKNMLIDGGPQSENFNAADFFILPFLKRKHIRHLDTIVLSHADNDHIGGLPEILRHISVQRVVDNGIYHDSDICHLYKFLLDAEHVAVSAPTMLDSTGSHCLVALQPMKDFLRMNPDDVNNNSVVLKLIYGEKKFLFTGDIEKEAEVALVRYGDFLQADVLKIAHHGSNTSSCEEFVQNVRPDFAVISVGKMNKFGFPSDEVIERLEKMKIKIARTDYSGAVVFRTNGKILERIR